METEMGFSERRRLEKGKEGAGPLGGMFGSDKDKLVARGRH